MQAGCLIPSILLRKISNTWEAWNEMLFCEIVKSNIQLTIFLATYMRSAIYLTTHIFVNFEKNIVSSWVKVKKDYWLKRICSPSWYQICLKQTYSKLPWAPRNTAKPVALIGTPEGQGGTSHKVGFFLGGGEGKRKQKKSSLKGRSDSRMWSGRPCVRETFHRVAMPPRPWHWSARLLLLLLLLLTPVQGAEEGDDDEDCWDMFVSTPEFPYERRSNAKFYRQERDLKLLEIILLVLQINSPPLHRTFYLLRSPPPEQ